MTTTLELPEDVLRDVRLYAQRHGDEFSSSVTKLLRDALKYSANNPISTKSPGIVVSPVTGLPCIEGSPDAPATRMSIEELLALEQASLYEEDLERLGISPG